MTPSEEPATGTVEEGGPDDMSSIPRPVDLTQVPTVPWAWVDERVYAAIRGCSVKVLQNERRLNMGCVFRRINGTTIRYKIGDIAAFLESQPVAVARQSPVINRSADLADCANP